MSLSLRAYARHRGVALSAVQKAIATGRIHPEPDGSIDPIKADAQWDRHTRAAQPTTPKASTSRASAPPPQASQTSDDTRGVDYQTSRAIREAYAARLAKLEYEERTAKLISSDEVEMRTFNLARRLRDRMQTIPRRLAAALAAEQDPRVIEQRLEDEIRQALEELSR